MGCRVSSMTASLVLLFLIGTALGARPVQIEEDPLAEGEEAIGDALSQETWGQRLRNLLAQPSWFYGSRPSYDRPSSSRPTFTSDPSYGKPSYGEPTYGRPGYGEPTYGRPSYGGPSYGKPSYGGPSYGKPSYGEPSYGKPSYGNPSYGESSYGNPGYGESSYGNPGYGESSYGTPDPSTVANGPQGSCRRGDRSAAALIACTNAFRANPSMSRCGGGMRPVGPLKANSQLISAAQRHSEAMDRARTMSHTLGGSTMSSRIRAAGYRGGSTAENVAAGQKDAYSVVESWMCSPGHRKNMMSCNYGDLGVGVSCNSGRCYWTQNFGCSGGCGCNGGGSGPSGGSGGYPSGAGYGGYPTSRPQPNNGYPSSSYPTSGSSYPTSRSKNPSYGNPTFSSRFYG